MNYPPGTIVIEREMTHAQIKEHSQPVVDVMNAQIAAGVPVDHVLMSVLFALGCALKGRGVAIDINAPLTEACGPLAAGYMAMAREKAGGAH